MRADRSDPPRWLTALLAGLPFGIAMGLWAKLDGAGWLGAGFMATSGIPFGLAMAWWAPRYHRGRQQVEGDLAPDQLKAARTAASRGPVPGDPEIRAAAIRIATHELSEASRHRMLRLLLPPVMLTAAVGATASGSPWALLYALIAAASLYLYWYRPHHLRRRLNVLTAPDPSTT